MLNPERVLEGREAFARLRIVLGELKPKTREIFLLNRLDGLSYTQIAVRYGLTPSAIEKHMMTALAHPPQTNEWLAMTPKQSQSPTDLEQEAARWVVRMHSDQVTIEDERAFARWIVESAAHRKEYDSQAATWASLGALSKDDEALKALSDLRAPVGRSLERRSMLAAAFAGALFLVAGGAAAWHSITSNQRYSTGLGEQQNIVLADGSQVTLNTDTTLRVELDGGERRVWLDHGQAFFHRSARTVSVRFVFSRAAAKRGPSVQLLMCARTTR